jgi:hypothetical protein
MPSDFSEIVILASSASPTVALPTFRSLRNVPLRGAAKGPIVYARSWPSNDGGGMPDTGQAP